MQHYYLSVQNNNNNNNKITQSNIEESQSLACLLITWLKDTMAGGWGARRAWRSTEVSVIPYPGPPSGEDRVLVKEP